MRDLTKKICITTTFDRHYKEGGKTLFNSIRRHTNCDGIDFKVITSDTEVLNEFGKENCHFVTDEIKARYANVKYTKELPVEKYDSSWYRYEIFGMTDYDRVICIDSDCICIKDISYLFSEELDQYDLISVEDHIVSKNFIKAIPQLEKHGLNLTNLLKRIKEGKIDIQPALLVANKTIVKEEWYKKLLNYANTSSFTYSIDEGILNDFIYMENLKIKLLPLEWDYQDCYQLHVPELTVPSKPIIIHCQESKPFKKTKTQLNHKMHIYHDMWWKENKPIQPKTLVVIIVWNRFENLRWWIHCWNQCNKMEAEMVVIHNLESNNDRYYQLCKDNEILYVPRENIGFDIGAFQDVCRERLVNFPNRWDNLIWFSDDCVPMSKDFVQQYLTLLTNNNIPCYEISDQVKTHVRTTGFLVTKEISKHLVFPRDPIIDREDCYQFEHESNNSLYDQLLSMGKNPLMIAKDLKLSPVWDSGVRSYLNLTSKHEQIFLAMKEDVSEVVINSVLDELAIKHISDKSSRFHNYAVKYDRILSPYRNLYSSILEIGVAQGQSIKMWTDYFPNATIHGADISETSRVCESYSNRIKFHILDQRKEAQLKNLEQFSPFDLIIDDGNHFWMEQILTFKTLFPYVRKGGIYIVEDTTTSYWPEYKNDSTSPIEFFKTLIDAVHLKGARGSVPINPPQEFGDWQKGWHRREDCHKNIPLFESIQFMNGFIVIYKAGGKVQNSRVSQHDTPYLRENYENRDSVLNIICTSYQRVLPLQNLINCFLLQTDPRWRLHIIHDGEPSTDIVEMINQYDDLRIRFVYTKKRNNLWGHPNRKIILDQLEGKDEDYVLITNDDNYYVPRFVEYMRNLSTPDTGMVYCNTIHSGINYNVHNSIVQEHRIDMGAFIVKFPISKKVGFNHVNFSADGKYAEECKNKCESEKLKIVYLPKPLFIHN